MLKKTLLLTGASGFLGRNIRDNLSLLYDIETLGLGSYNKFDTDLSKSKPEFSRKYDIILHAAGKAHVIAGTGNSEKQFFQINLQGTKNLCHGLERSGMPEVFIYISSVAVYGLDQGQNITEDYPLKGKTPYAASKIQTEIFLQEWCSNHKIILGILRPSLLAGPNPPGNLGSMITGIRKGRYLRIGDGQARKSMLMVEDISRLIPKICEKGGVFNVCDDHHPSFHELECLISEQLGKKLPISIPLWTAVQISKIGDILGERFPLNTNKLQKITNTLTFSNAKAKNELTWQPMDVLNNFRVSD